MAENNETWQTTIAHELAEQARLLAHSTRIVPNPAESFALLGDLAAVQRSLAQVYSQLAAWHRNVIGGTDYDGQDPGDEPTPATATAATRLTEAAAAAAVQAGAALTGVGTAARIGDI